MGLFKKSEFDERIEELCGGFICNDAFKARAARFKSTQWISNTYEKSILKHEFEDGTLALDDIENRLDELLQLDCETLDSKIRIRLKMDTSRFKTQDDINAFMGEEYTRKYFDKLKKNQSKHNAQFKRDGISKLRAIEKHNIFKGVEAYVEYPDLRLDSLTVIHASRGNAIVRVCDDGVAFRSGNDEFLIKNEAIISVGDGRNFKLKVNLIHGQAIEIQFDIKGIFFSSQDKGYVEEHFMYIVNGQAAGLDHESELLEIICPECGTVNGENQNFCVNCGRKL